MPDHLQIIYFPLVLGISGVAIFFLFRFYRKMLSSEASFNRLFSSAQEAIVICDDRWRISRANRPAFSLLGIEPDSKENSDIFTIMGISRGEIDKIERDAASDDANAFKDLSFVNRKGKAKSVKMRVSDIVSDHGNNYRIVSLQDLSKLKKLTQQTSLAQSLAGIGQISSGFAHQLNSPLATLLLNNQILAEQLDEKENKRLIESNLRLIERCRYLIKDFLSLAPKDGEEEESVSLSEFFETLVDSLGKGDIKEGIIVELSGLNESWIVKMNVRRMENALLNMIKNASDAMPDGGRINIECLESPPGTAEISIIDEGLGVPAEIRHRIFDPFYSTKGPVLGSGLGLTIAKEIISSAGGNLELAETSGQGATFIVKLPLVENEVG